MRVHTGLNAHLYAATRDELCIKKVDLCAQQNTRQDSTAGKNNLEAAAAAEGLLYRPEIDNFV